MSPFKSVARRKTSNTEVVQDGHISASGEVQDAWTSIYRTVRTVDEDKVKDCTDDIDTLLIFATLYAAVLTAFLTESYKMLQQDPKEKYLDQIALQTANYTSHNHSINSTFTSSQLSPFRTPDSVIKVNVCWFVSLIISLTTAFYGILVKQWIRVYLAMDATTPQERIRIRHFRVRCLEDWKLFEIAAILPFLLQISLALFFVGLCFFTLAVHPSIGWTSVGLVGGWALFFILTILAPLLSPRCPYKPALLKLALLCIWHHISRSVKSPVKDTSSPPTGNQQLQEGLAVLEDSVDDTSLRYFIENEKYRLKEDTSIQEEAKIRSSPANDLFIFLTIDKGFLDDNLLALVRKALKQRPPSGREVLSFAVAVMQHRLGDALPKIKTVSTSERVQWPSALSYFARASLIDIVADSLLFELSKTAVTIGQWYKAFGDQSQGNWTKDAIAFIFTLTSLRDPVSSTATSLFENLLQESDALDRPGRYMLARYLQDDTWKSSKDWPIRVFSCIAEALKIHATHDGGWTFQAIVHEGCVEPGSYFARHEDTYGRLLAKLPNNKLRPVPNNQHRNVIVTPEMVAVLVEIAVMILHTITVRNATNEQRTTVFPQGFTPLLNFVLKAVPKINNLAGVSIKKPRNRGGIGLDELLVGLFTTPRLIFPFLDFFSTHSEYLATSEIDRVRSNPDTRLSDFLLDPLSNASWIRDLSCEANVAILSTCADYFQSKMRSETPKIPLTLVSTLRLCLLVYMFDTVNDQETVAAWHELFAKIGACIDQLEPALQVADQCHGLEPRVEHKPTCEAAYAILKDIDTSRYNHGKHSQSDGNTPYDPAIENERYSQWLEQFEDDPNQVPDEMIKQLCRFVCDERMRKDGNKFWRVRRLQHRVLPPTCHNGYGAFSSMLRVQTLCGSGALAT